MQVHLGAARVINTRQDTVQSAPLAPLAEEEEPCSLSPALWRIRGFWALQSVALTNALVSDAVETRWKVVCRGLGVPSQRSPADKVIKFLLGLPSAREQAKDPALNGEVGLYNTPSLDDRVGGTRTWSVVCVREKAAPS